MFPVDVPACHCRCSRAFVGWNEYRGVGACNGAVSVSGRGALNLFGALGKGGLEGPHAWELGPGADRPGMDGLVGGWARLTRSSPDESDSLSDLESWWSLVGAGIDCVNFNSFAGN